MICLVVVIFFFGGYVWLRVGFCVLRDMVSEMFFCFDEEEMVGIFYLKKCYVIIYKYL